MRNTSVSKSIQLRRACCHVMKISLTPTAYNMCDNGIAATAPSHTKSSLGLWPTTSNSTRVSPMRRIGKATAGDAWQCHSGSWPDPEPRHAQTAARTHVPSSTLSRNVTLGLGASSTRAVPQEEHRKDTAAPYCCVGTPCHTSHHCRAPLYSDPHYDHKSPRRPAGSAMQCDSTWRALWSTSGCPSQLRGRFRCSSLGGVASPGCSCSCS